MATIICNGVEFQSIEAIIFDKDGTLANSHPYLNRLGEKRAELIDAIVPNLKAAILETFGCSSQLDPAGLMAVGTREENEIAIVNLIQQKGFNHLEARSIVQSTFQLVDRQLPRKATLTPPFAGIISLIQSLNSLKLGILSSDVEPNIRDFTKEYNLTDFQAFVGAQPGISKPNPKLLFMICEALDVEPESALVIGDTIADTKLTSQSIGVTWSRSTIAQLQGAAAIAHQPSDIQLRHT